MINPNLDHIDRATFRHVYEPDSDSFCLMDALQHDLATLRTLKPRTVLDIGSGSGVLGAHLSLLLREAQVTPQPKFFAVDRNPKAAVTSLQTLKANGVRDANVLHVDLTTAVMSRFEGLFDVIIFNPPYVPTDVDELQGDDIEISCSGGPNGTYVLEHMLPHIVSLLSRRGYFYLLFIEQNHPLDFQQFMEQHYPVKGEVIFKRFSGERYTITRFSRVDPDEANTKN